MANAMIWSIPEIASPDHFCVFQVPAHAGQCTEQLLQGFHDSALPEQERGSLFSLSCLLRMWILIYEA